MEDPSISDSEDEKRIMSMSWRKLETQLLTNSFREGALTGKNDNFQTSFDRGFADGFQKSRNLGIKIGEQRILHFLRQSERVEVPEQYALRNLCTICLKQRENIS